MSRHTDHKPHKVDASDELEVQIFRSLVDKGEIIPETETEVRQAEKRIETTETKLPESLQDARAFLDRLKSKTDHGDKIVQMPCSHFTRTGEELAWAARKGSEIPREIAEKMRRNRLKLTTAAAQTAIAEPRKASKQWLLNEREAELSDLASAVVETHCGTGRIDPEKIVHAKGISLFYDTYGDSFDGMIEYDAGHFYIHCNLDRENSPGTPRARFTLAHELAHFFIDEHRNNLSSGRVCPHPSFSDKCVADLDVEREADFFASRLLLPDARFKQIAEKSTACLQGIEAVAEEFDVSLTCAAIRFVTAEVFPSVIIKWSNDGYSWKWCSRQFWVLGLRKTIESPAALPKDSATAMCLARQGNERSIFETGTTAASWFRGISQQSAKNVILREEARALGRFGVLTLLTLYVRHFPQEAIAMRNYELGIE